MRPPVAPIGWPSEMPDPLTLRISFRLSSSDQPQPLSTASTCGAKASLSSTRSISSQPSPPRANSRDRESDVSGKSVPLRVEPGGRRFINKQIIHLHNTYIFSLIHTLIP